MCSLCRGSCGSWLNAVCLSCQERGRADVRHGKAQTSSLIPRAGGSDLLAELRDGEGAAGGTARELVRAVFTRRGFSTAEVPTGICQAALPGKAAEVSLQQLQLCLSLCFPARLLLPVLADPGPRHALKAD